MIAGPRAGLALALGLVAGATAGSAGCTCEGEQGAPARAPEPRAEADSRDGRQQRIEGSTLDLRALRRRGALEALEPVTVEIARDPVYEKRKRFRGYRLPDLLGRLRRYAEREGAEWTVRFAAADGYTVSAPLNELPVEKGLVAFRDLESAARRDFEPVQKGSKRISPAPFYLVWDVPDADSSRLPWPYQLVEIALTKGTTYARAAPEGDGQAERGYALFETHCIKCHSINLAGGRVGPELNVPKNITEYWQPSDLRQYIRNPSSYRAGAEMPAFDSLEQEQLQTLLAYLRAMKSQKICSSAQACAERRHVP